MPHYMDEDSQWERADMVRKDPLTSGDLMTIEATLRGTLSSLERRAVEAQEAGSLDLLDMLSKQAASLRGATERLVSELPWSGPALPDWPVQIRIRPVAQS